MWCRAAPDPPSDPHTLLTAVPFRLSCSRVRQGAPIDDLIQFIFESLLDQRAVEQIKECAVLLKGLCDASEAKIRTQQAVLKGVTSLVTEPKHGDAMLKKTPAILMALYDNDLIEEAVVVKWHAHPLGQSHEAGRKVREAAAPFIQWLAEAEEESSADEIDKDEIDKVVEALEKKKAEEKGGKKKEKKEKKEEEEEGALPVVS